MWHPNYQWYLLDIENSFSNILLCRNKLKGKIIFKLYPSPLLPPILNESLFHSWLKDCQEKSFIF